MKKNTGFTLIELLVVIAIIGILSSVVLASLNTARSKGSDAAIKSQMNSLRSQALLYYDTNGQSYTNLYNDPQIRKIVDATVAQGVVVSTSSVAGATFMAIAALKSTTTVNFCVDSAGNAVATSSAVAITSAFAGAGTVCQ